MLLHRFTKLKLHRFVADRHITGLAEALAHLRKPSVLHPTRAFLGALLECCRCSRRVIAHPDDLIIAFGIAQTRVAGPIPSLDAVISAAQELTEAVQAVLEQCGTSPNSTLEPLSRANRLRFRSAAEGFAGARLALLLLPPTTTNNNNNLVSSQEW